MTRGTDVPVSDRFADVGTCASSGCAVRLCYNIFDPSPVAAAAAVVNKDNANESSSDGTQLPCVLLLAGIASPAAMWDEALCRDLAAAVPCRVIRFDQRDTGLSTHMTHHHNNIIASKSSATPMPRQHANNTMSDKCNAATTTRGDKNNASDDDDDDEDDLLALVQPLSQTTTAAAKPVARNVHNNTDGSSSSSTSKAVGEHNNSTSGSARVGGGEAFGARTYLRYAAALLRPGHYVVPSLYTLDDMACDVMGLLRVLDIAAVHLVGFSLGGMVAQCVALQQPHRVRSLTLLATHTSEPDVAQWPSMRDLLSFARYLPRHQHHTTTTTSSSLREEARQTTTTTNNNTTQSPQSHSGVVVSADEVHARASDAVRFLERVWGDARRYPFPQAEMLQQATAVMRRCPHVEGAVRHFAVLINATGRDAALRRCLTSRAPSAHTRQLDNTAAAATTTGIACARRNAATSSSNNNNKDDNSKDDNSKDGSSSRGPVYVPTVIVQGTHDILCPPRNAAHLASVIDGSRVHLLPGMGHVLVPQLYSTYVQLIADNVRTGQAYARTAAAPPPQQPTLSTSSVKATDVTRQRMHSHL